MIGNDAFGIDHPLIAVHDINRVRERLCQLGFSMTPVGRHPWGTSTSLAIFDGCLLEIVGIHDERLLDVLPAGEFCFGRHVHEHLQEREGVALTALHSQQAEVDAARANAAGLQVSGMLEFGREVTLPDETTDRTRTTLALMPDLQYPRLSFFLCQQHRPDLVYVPAWMHHPNGVSGIDGITILAAAEHHEALSTKLGTVYGAARAIDGGFQMQTANGCISVMHESAVREVFAELPASLSNELSPMIVALDFRCLEPDKLMARAAAVEIGLRQAGDQFILQAPELFGNTLFRFSHRT